MRSKPVAGRKLLVLIIGVAMALGLAVGVLGLGTASATSQAVTATGRGPAPVFPRNASGETYGSDLHSFSRATEPDLILAQGVGGTIGYVRAVDLLGKMPKTPQEAVAMDSAGARSIPLYAADGKTIIGTFIIGASQGHPVNTPQPRK